MNEKVNEQFAKEKLVCEICRDDRHLLARFCNRCKKLLDRVDRREKVDKEARVHALKRAWHEDGFRCYYTHIQLVENEPKNPCYITFDHKTPRQKDDIVVTSAVLNDMKSDMDEDEFKKVVSALADFLKRGAKFEIQVLRDLKHWKR